MSFFHYILEFISHFRIPSSTSLSPLPSITPPSPTPSLAASPLRATYLSIPSSRKQLQSILQEVYTTMKHLLSFQFSLTKSECWFSLVFFDFFQFSSQNAKRLVKVLTYAANMFEIMGGLKT